MEILFMVFMVVVSIMALFAVMVVFRDVIQEVLASRRERDKQSADILAHAERIIAQAQEAKAAPAPAEEPTPTVPAEEPVATEVAAEEEVAEEEVAEEEVAEEELAEEKAEEAEEEAAATEAEEAAEAEGAITFAVGQKQTLEEKYLALSAEQRKWYDEIIKHASAVEGSRRFKNVRYEEYKVGKNRLVRLLIKRGIIHCEFILHNSDFKNYINENKISVRQAATTMRVENAATVDAVKNSIDIAVAAIAEEKEYKKKLAREKRKAARASAAAEETDAQDA